MGRERKEDRVVVCDGVEFMAPSGRVRANWIRWLNMLLIAAIGVWGVSGAFHRHPYVAVAIGVFYIEACLVQIPALIRSGGVVFRDDLARKVATPLRELTAIAHCAVPRVVLRDDAIRVAVVVQVRRAVRLILSSQWADSVGDRQLRAVVAHELAHVVHSDFRAIKIRQQVALYVGIAASIAFTVIATGTVTLSMYVALIPLFALGARVPLSVLNRRLERQADSGGAQLSGDPNGLAMALVEVKSFGDATRRRLYGAKPWRWLLFPLSFSMPTHPAMSKRVRMLTETARDQMVILPSSGP